MKLNIFKLTSTTNINVITNAALRLTRKRARSEIEVIANPAIQLTREATTSLYSVLKIATLLCVANLRRDSTAIGSRVKRLGNYKLSPQQSPNMASASGEGSAHTPVGSSAPVAETRGQQTTTSSAPAPSGDMPASPETYEATHVHAVYEAIAPHFSSTRHKPWPFVSTFLRAQRAGSVGLDVGCGNGKYLPVNPALHMLGSDYSAALVRLARTERQGEVAVADGLALPYRPASVDFAICIAVIHHLSTRERRQEAIAKLLECVRPGEGRVLVYVWALEQGSSRRGFDEGSAQDTLVPWVMKAKGTPDTTYERYYHLYRKGELEEDAQAAGGTIVESGYERDNWWVICSRPA